MASAGDVPFFEQEYVIETWIEAWLDGTAAGVRVARLRAFEENGRARRFYEKQGWVATSRRSRTSFPPHPLLVEYERRLQAG